MAQDSDPAAVAIYTDAANLQNNGAYQLALEDWKKFVAKYPTDPLRPKAEYYLGVCALQLKKWSEAEAAFDAVIKNHPKFDDREVVYLNLGWSQYNEAQGLAAGEAQVAAYQKAADSFTAMLKEFPPGKGQKADQALYFQGEALYRKGDKEGAVAAYSTLTKQFAESSLRADSLYAQGVTLEELGKYDAAAPVYDTFLTEFPESELATEVKMRKAETILQDALKTEGDGANAKFTSAAALFAEAAAVEGFVSRDHALMRQAVALGRKGDVAAAADIYAKVATDFPQSSNAPIAMHEAAKGYYNAEKLDLASEWCAKVIAGGGENAGEAAHWASKIARDKEQFAEAKKIAVDAIKNFPDSKFLVWLKIDEAEALDRIEGSREESMQKFLAISTEHKDSPLAPQALYSGAHIAMNLGKLSEAVASADEFLKTYPENTFKTDVLKVLAESHYLLGAKQSLAAKGQPDAVKMQAAYAKAIPEYQAAIGVETDWAGKEGALLELAYAQYQTKKIDDAIKTIVKVKADFPESKDLYKAHYRHGEFLYAKGDNENAIKEYDASLAASPDSAYAPFAYYNRGWAQMNLKDYAAGKGSFDQLLEKWPTHESLELKSLFARGMCQRQLKEYDAAIADLDKSIAKDGLGVASKADALYEKAMSQVSLNKNAEAAETFQAVLATKPDYHNTDKVLYELGWSYKSQEGDENQKKAIETFAKLATDFPDSDLTPEAHLHVADDLYQSEKYEDAIKQLTTAKAVVKKPELAEKIVYKLGWSNFQLKNYDAALVEFKEQVDKYGDRPLNVDGLFMKAECLFRLENSAEALPAYEAAAAAAAAAENVNETILVFIQLHGGQAAGQQSQWAKSLEFLEVIPEKYADSDLLPEANYEIGWAHHNQMNPAKAIEYFTKAATGSRTAVGARGRFMLGEEHFQAKDYEKASAEFVRCLFGYGGNAAADDVKKWQAKSAYELGRLNEVRIADAEGDAKKKYIADALKYYQTVVDQFGTDDLAKTAAERIVVLKKL